MGLKIRNLLFFKNLLEIVFEFSREKFLSDSGVRYLLSTVLRKFQYPDYSTRDFMANVEWDYVQPKSDF